MQTPPAEHASSGVFSRHNLLSLYLPALTLALGAGVATPAVPVFAKSFEVSVGVASLVFVANLLGGMCSTIPTGILVDRIGRRRVIIAGPLLVALAAFLMATATSFPQVLAYQFMAGWAQSMWTLSRLAMIADTGGDRQRGRQITGLVGVESAGRLLGPAFGGVLAELYGIQAPFVALGLLALVSVIPSVALIKESAPGLRAGERGSGGSWRATLVVLLTATVLWFFLAQFLSSITRGVLFVGSVHLYPVYVYGAGAGTIGVISTIAGVVGLPITFLMGAVMDRFGRRATVVPGFLLLGVALAFAAYTDFAQLGFETYVVAFVLVMAAQSITSGNMQVIGSDIAPAHVRGRFFGIWQLIGQLGTTSSPAAFAFLAEASGYTASFLFLSFTSFGTAFVLMVLVGETLRRGPSGRSDHAAEGPVASSPAPRGA
jgi:MFS family permease